MLNTMINSSVTMGQIQKQMDIISNNMSNLGTAGFKRKEVSFNDLLYQQFNNQTREGFEEGRRSPEGIRQGVGAALGQVSLRMDQGSIKQTERALDVAIANPNQFFQISKEGETLYTRDGKFYLSPRPDGTGVDLVTANGEHVQGKNGNIILPEGAKDITITEFGVVKVSTANNGEVIVDQLDMVSVVRPQLLNAVGGNKFTLPENLVGLNLNEEDLIQVTNNGDVALRQGALEMSNVDTGKEMTELMLAQKSYQFNAQALRMSNDMFGLINQLR
ncbi:flagellar hook-basal body protein (plasmid) [Rossellomorea sp. AcN35-11]|nr:flagellar hook-basal body protein [Rossellomorea aquimaris]WJV32241.1 flagellar hook-basal body protein [Rossellomorea sp. AcN35-11]